MDQTEPAHQSVLRHDGKRGEGANLDRDHSLRAGRDPQEADESEDPIIQDSPSFQRPRLRENSNHRATL